MDALGFALENFDAVGKWRESADGFAVEAAGELADGTGFDGAGELEHLLANDTGVARCIAKKLATYALGRGLRDADEPAIDDVLAHASGRELTLGDLISGVVHTDAFRRRVVADKP
jgi:hypothetical protein